MDKMYCQWMINLHKRKKILSFVTTYMKLGGFYAKKTILHIITYIWNLEKKYCILSYIWNLTKKSQTYKNRLRD